MSVTWKIKLSLAFVVALLPGGIAMSGQPAARRGMSPALCGPDDIREPGIQGDLPAGEKPNYHCGVRLVSQLPRAGNVAGDGKWAYVRSGGKAYVIDVGDPAKPVEVTSVPLQSGSETMRVVVTSKRAVLVSGSSVYDIKDRAHPVLLGEIEWPPMGTAGPGTRLLPHDIRVNREGTKVYASFGVWEADITNLQDPKTWKVTDHRCELAQQPGPWFEPHQKAVASGKSVCTDFMSPSPLGQFAHSPDFNADDTRLYVGDQAAAAGTVPKVRIIDLKKKPLKVIGEVEGPGHGLDWFRVGGRQYLLYSNEGGTGGIAGQPNKGDTCKPYPRPSSLGWGFEVFVTDVTRPERAKTVSMLRIAVNDPEFCDVRKASGRDPWIAYHLIDNPMNAKFAAVNFGSAGLRIFDIRKPASPIEVAYYNHGPFVHAGVGYYDAARGLIYAAASSGFSVLEIEPQVRARLGL